MKKREPLINNFLKFLVEKYNKKMQEEIEDEEIDDLDNIEEPAEPRGKLKEDDDLNLDELIEEYNKLTNKYKTLKNDNTLYKRR